MARLVYIVRHGNTFDKGDTVTRVGARTDLPLSVSGEAQALDLAQHFAGQGLSFAEAYCSPLARTRQTAEIILASYPEAPALQTAEFLREVDYGPDENQPEEAVIARLGEAAIQAWDEAAIVPDGWLIDPDAVRKAWQDFFDTLDKTQNRPVLVVTSNGIARFALQLAASQEQTHALKLKTGAYGVIAFQAGGQPHVEHWNIRP